MGDIPRRVLRIVFPDTLVDNMEKAESGKAHATFFATLGSGKEVVVQYCADEELEDRFEVAAHTIQKLREETDVVVPTVLAHDHSKEDVPYMYMVTEKLPGAVLKHRYRYFSQSRKETLLRQAATALARIHKNAGFERFGHLRWDAETDTLQITGPEKWGDVFNEILTYKLDNTNTEWFPDVVPRLRDAVDTYIHLLDDVEHPTVVHQDYGPRNLLTRGGELTGVLDWERAVAGHHEYDLFKAEDRFTIFRTKSLRKMYGQVFRDAYTNIYELEGGWRKRRAFYRLAGSIERMWTFESWTNPDKRGEIVDQWLRDFVETRIEELRNTVKDDGTL